MDDTPEKEALEEFIYGNVELERLEEIIEEFNIFTALNIVNNEIRHSSFLAWLMDPNESHGLGDYFLSFFLKKMAYKASSLGVGGLSIFDIDSWHFDDAEVLREWRRMDILVRSDEHKFACVVENKIHSKEHSRQLQRYREIVQREYPGYEKLFVYLTIEGDIPSDENYVPLSYSDVIPLLEHLIESKRDKVGFEILAFISHYKEMLRRYVMNDSEIQDICRKIYRRHKKALDLIFEYRPDKQLEISECLVDIIQSDPDLILDDSSKSHIRFLPESFDFIPRESEWTKSKRILLFELLNEERVDMYLVIFPGPQEIREKLYEIAKGDQGLFNRSNRNLTPQFFTIYKKPILKPKEYEEKEVGEIRQLLEERLKSFKDTDLSRVVDKINEFDGRNG